MDDQALFFDTAEGLVVLLGCGHAGVVNTLEYVRRLTGGRPIHAVLGGMHLLTASPERLERDLWPRFAAWMFSGWRPAHCTGLPALARLWNAFPGRCCSCAVGASWAFQSGRACSVSL